MEVAVLNLVFPLDEVFRRDNGRSLWTESTSSASKAGQCSLWLNAPEYLDEFLFVVAGISAAVLTPQVLIKKLLTRAEAHVTVAKKPVQALRTASGSCVGNRIPLVDTVRDNCLAPKTVEIALAMYPVHIARTYVVTGTPARNGPYRITRQEFTFAVIVVAIRKPLVCAVLELLSERAIEAPGVINKP